jgi:integrase
MSVHKRGKFYWYDFVLDGVRYQGSTKQGDFRAAGEIEGRKRTQLAKERDDKNRVAKRLRCTPGDVAQCPECEKWYDSKHPATAADGKTFCSDACRQAWEKRSTPVPALGDFADRFMQKMEADHASKPKTVIYYRVGLNHLLHYEPMRNAKLDQIGDELISDFSEWRRSQKKGKKNKKPITIATVNRDREVLRHLLHIAHEWKKIPSVPKIRRLAGEQGRDRVVSHEEEHGYLGVAKQPLRDIATMLIDTGLRPEEAFRARWENLHLEPAGNARYGYIFNPFGKTKYAKRNVPLTARVKALLEMRHESQGRPKEGWVFPAPTKTGHVERLKSQHSRALADAKVRPFVLYSLRHTMLTRLGESGAEAFTIQKVAGHSSALISQRYVHPTPALIENAFARFESYNAGKIAELATDRVQ